MNSNNGSVYDRNIGALLLRYPAFKDDIIGKYLPSDELSASETAEGPPTARIDGLWVHSSRAPLREARRLVESGIKKKSGLCIVYGFGLGYHIDELLRQFPDLQVIIVEPEPALFLKALQIRDCTGIIESERIGFLLETAPQSASGILNNFRTLSIQSIRLRSVFDRNADYYGAFDEEVKAFIRKRETNMNTLTRFGRTWTRNLFRNIEVFRRARDTGEWYGRFIGIPAIVLAAGPSLDDLLPQLAELQKRCLLICVDTALRAVVSAGIAPDFVVVVDPQYLNTRHLDNLLDSDFLRNSILISESSTHPAVFRSCRLPVYFFKSVFPLGKLLEQHAGIRSELGAGGSVSTTAWDFARRCGCTGVYAGGLDLGFPGKRTHCRTSLSALYSQLRAGRTLSVDGVNFAGVNGAEPFAVPNNSGGETLTDQRLIIYKWWFEGQIKILPADNLYNLSPLGIGIEGMRYIPSGELSSLSAKRHEIDEIKRFVLQAAEDAESSESDASRSNFNDIRELISAIVSECSRLEKICAQAADELERIKSLTDGQQINKGFQKLSEFDTMISNSPSKELTGFIIQPVLNEIIDQDNDGFENSEKLYNSILEAAKYHRIHAERALNRILI